ncbi:MAG: hypothetical protein WC246_03050 [Candidatus Paceibacterota bacterium]|jgi:F-type H+-transporting ATPase subunit b
MKELIEKLGLDWRLLLTQAINFGIILVVLRFTVYKPALAILRKRKEKIVEGMEKAERADQTLQDARTEKAHLVAQAHRESTDIVARALQKGKEQEAVLLAQAHAKEEEVLTQARIQVKREAEESHQQILRDAETLIARGIHAVAQNHPEPFDAALITQAIDAVKKKSITRDE